MNGDQEIGKAYGHINTIASKLGEKIHDVHLKHTENMHQCQLQQLKVVSEFKLEVAEKINILATSVEKYVSAATEHEGHQEKLLKRMLDKTDKQHDQLEELEGMKKEFDDNKKSRKRTRLTVWIALTGVILAWIKDAVIGFFKGGVAQ